VKIRFLLISKSNLVLLAMLVIALLLTNTVNAATRYSVATGDWNSTATWSATSGGTPGASVQRLH
jgi:hypothetical protein